MSKGNNSGEAINANNLNIPKTSKFGDRLAMLGGLNKSEILNEDALKTMGQDAIDKYSQKWETAKGRGMQDFLWSLGSAFKGDDIGKSLGDFREQRAEREDAERVLDLNKQISQAYLDGDYDLVNSLLLEKGDGSGVQAISQRINKQRDKISTDGKLKYIFDEDNNIIGVEPNYEVIDALDKKSGLSSSEIRMIREDNTKISSLDRQLEEAQEWEQMIENDEIVFGWQDDWQDWWATKTGMGDDQESINSRNFLNWRNGMVTKLLNLQTGTKTDFDWEAVKMELESVNSKAGYLAWLKHFKRGILAEKRANEENKDLIIRNAQGEDISLGDLDFKIEE